MATITPTSTTYYYKGKTGATKYVGYESLRTRIVRYEFTTPSSGVSSFSFAVSGIEFVAGVTSGGLRFYVGSSSSSHADASPTDVYHGVVNIASNVASGSANIILEPSSVYYLWIFPATTSYGYWNWGDSSITMTVVGSASSVSLSASSVNIGSTITANITRASSSFKHTVEFYIDNTYYQKYTNVDSVQNFVIPTEWSNYMPSSTSCTAYCRVTTYNDGSQIGNSTTKSFTVVVPNAVPFIPTVGTITLDPTDINGNNILVKSKNTLKISVVNCSAGSGSSIKSYTFSGPSLEPKTTDETTVTTAIITEDGTLTYKVKVTDARGRTSEKTAAITCYDYSAPSFSAFNAYRANSDGSANANGTYLKCTYTVNYSSVNSTNDINVIMYYNGLSQTVTNGTALINLNGDTNTTYQVYLKITDLYGASITSNTVTVFGQTRVFNVTKDGTGFSIGKMAESSELFECRWDAKFNNAIDCNDFTIQQKTIFDLIYPVGSIYMSVNQVDPSSIFGGKWERIKDTFLLSAGDTYTAGDTGGEAQVTLTTNQMPKHKHTATSEYSGADFYIRHGSTSGTDMVAAGTNTTIDEGVGEKWSNGVSTSSYSHNIDKININGTVTTTVGESGSGAAHNNMPPYLAVFVWKRVS